MWTLAGMICTALWIGATAQLTRGRTGALWGFLTLLLQAPAVWIADRAYMMGLLSGEDMRMLDVMLYGTAVIVPFFVMLFIVWTLPNRSPAQQS